jgi:hypothetical protein
VVHNPGRLERWWANTRATLIARLQTRRAARHIMFEGKL